MPFPNLLINQCHERGRYHLLNYQAELDPPLPPEEATWVDEILRAHALRWKRDSG